MRLIFNGKKDYGPKEVKLMRRDLHPLQVEADSGSGALVIQMSASVMTHLEGDYDLRLELTKNEISILARTAFGQLPFETVIDALSPDRIHERLRASAKTCEEL